MVMAPVKAASPCVQLLLDRWLIVGADSTAGLTFSVAGLVAALGVGRTPLLKTASNSAPLWAVVPMTLSVSVLTPL